MRVQVLHFAGVGACVAQRGAHFAFVESLQREDMAALGAFLRQRKAQGARIYPPGAQIFSAFDATAFDAVKVVILGQDPYHGAGQAHGLCFSVRPGVPVPPSLDNIYKEIQRDLGIARPDHGCLTPWSERGVLLLNAVLTVEDGRAGAHQGKGWEGFTDHVVDVLNREREGLVFVHPYDDEAIVAGQGTVGLEMMRAVPDLDTLVIAVGGGGLIAGIATAAKAINPHIDILGVQTSRFPAMVNAIKGTQHPQGSSTIADGIAVGTPGQIPLTIIKALVSDILLALVDPRIRLE